MFRVDGLPVSIKIDRISSNTFVLNLIRTLLRRSFSAKTSPKGNSIVIGVQSDHLLGTKHCSEREETQTTSEIPVRRRKPVNTETMFFLKKSEILKSEVVRCVEREISKLAVLFAVSI